MKANLNMLVVGAACLAVSACGGGGSGVSSGGTLAIAPTPPPTTPPPPSPPPTSGFNTVEYQNSNAAAQANAIAAYDAGATGTGIVAAVIDSGIATNNAEFAGRIHANSADVAGNRSINDEDEHGTAVSSILLGAKNDSQTHGVAFGATLLVARADAPDSCTPSGGCDYNDNDIARGVDLAVANRARVINISLGGTPANRTLITAIDRATAAGAIIVISAGNEFETDPVNSANPDPFAQIALQPEARGLIIIAGAVDSAHKITTFANRAGNGANLYISALGRLVRSINETGTAFRYDGTSFSAPVISGAVALLAQAFPNLTSAQIVDLLLKTATDLGEPGIDAIYGRGELNIARAFAPQGATRFAGSEVSVSPLLSGTLSAAMGDARMGAARAVILDSYGRAYALDLANIVSPGLASSRLNSGLRLTGETMTIGSGGAAFSLSLAANRQASGIDRTLLSAHEQNQVRALAGAFHAKLSSNTLIAFGIRNSSARLGQSLRGQTGLAYLSGTEATQSLGFDARSQSSAALLHKFGPVSTTISAEKGEANLFENTRFSGTRNRQISYGYGSISLDTEVHFGRLGLSAGLSNLRETETILGAHFREIAGNQGASTLFADGGVALDLGNRLQLAATFRNGWTFVKAGGIMTHNGHLRSNAWSIDLTGQGLFTKADRFGLRVSQPLRVTRGGFNLTIPVAYDYGSLATTYDQRFFALTPRGEEQDFEAIWISPMMGGTLSTNLYWRVQPGNVAASADDKGVAVRFTKGF